MQQTREERKAAKEKLREYLDQEVLEWEKRTDMSPVTDEEGYGTAPRKQEDSE